MSHWPLLSIVTFLPLLGAIIIMMLPEKSVRAIQAVAVGATGLSFLMSVGLFWSFYTLPASARAGFCWVEQIPWLPQLGISYHLGVDGLSMPMLLLSGIIAVTAAFMSLSIDKRQREYFALALTAITGVFGVFLSVDLFFLLLFYEMASIPMYFLVGIWGSDKSGSGRPVKKEAAAMKLLLYLQLGGGLVLLGILGLYYATGTHSFDFTVLRHHIGAIGVGWQRWLFLVLFLGFGIEAGLVPFHTWLPDGHSSAPTALSMLLAGVLLKMGGYGILRLGLELLPQGAHAWMQFFIYMAVLNIIYGGLCALRQTDIKVMIAYSSVSHMGMVFLGIACINSVGQTYVMYGLSGAMFQMFSHGIITALLFALAGAVYGVTHSRDLMQWGGLAARMPYFATIYILGALGSLGLPGMTGFVAELMVLIGTWKVSWVLACVAIIGLIITTTYLLRSAQYAFYGPLNPVYKGVRDANIWERIPTALLACTTLVFGFCPWLLVNLMNPTLLTIAKEFIR